MLKDIKAFSGFSVDDVTKAAAFYRDKLGLDVSEANGMLTLNIAGDRPILVYPKGDAHEAATYTILNFPVDDVAATVRRLKEAGVEFEHYGGEIQTDADGVMRGNGPDIAWFKDPAGNIFSVIARDADTPT